MSLDFDFDALTPDEKALIRIMIDHWRGAKFRGVRWHSLMPDVGGVFDYTIHLPDSIKNAKQHFPPDTSKPFPATEKLSSPVSDLSSPASSLAHSTSETTKKQSSQDQQGKENCQTQLSECHSCRECLLVMFHIEQHRMSAGEARQWLADHGKQYKEKTVETVLTQLRTDGQLNNIKDGHGKGFGLAEWQ